ncbi:hypothetical protein BC828DRAFT_378877 [Blastocladiella britannica]|nr:hypothetical protein BC828DRAFT_378877 [Blastocladiella britannica]
MSIKLRLADFLRTYAYLSTVFHSDKAAAQFLFGGFATTATNWPPVPEDTGPFIREWRACLKIAAAFVSTRQDGVVELTPTPDERHAILTELHNALQLLVSNPLSGIAATSANFIAIVVAGVEIPFPASVRDDMVAWASRHLVSIVRPSKVGRLLRSVAFNPMVDRNPIGTNSNSTRPAALPLERVAALRIALSDLEQRCLIVVDRVQGTVRSSKITAADTPATRTVVQRAGTLPWLPSHAMSLPDELRDPQFVHTLLSDALGNSDYMRVSDAYRSLDASLAKIESYVPRRSVLARGILSAATAHGLIQPQRVGDDNMIRVLLTTPSVHTTTPALFWPPSGFFCPPFDTAVHHVCHQEHGAPPHPLLLAYTKATWKWVRDRRACTATGQMHRLVFFSEGIDTYGLVDSDRWIVAEAAVWRAWQHGMVDIKLNSHLPSPQTVDPSQFTLVATSGPAVEKEK